MQPTNVEFSIGEEGNVEEPINYKGGIPTLLSATATVWLLGLLKFDESWSLFSFSLVVGAVCAAIHCKNVAKNTAKRKREEKEEQMVTEEIKLFEADIAPFIESIKEVKTLAQHRVEYLYPDLKLIRDKQRAGETRLERARRERAQIDREQAIAWRERKNGSSENEDQLEKRLNEAREKKLKAIEQAGVDNVSEQTGGSRAPLEFKIDMPASAMPTYSFKKEIFALIEAGGEMLVRVGSLATVPSAFATTRALKDNPSLAFIINAAVFLIVGGGFGLYKVYKENIELAKSHVKTYEKSYKNKKFAVLRSHVRFLTGQFNAVTHKVAEIEKENKEFEQKEAALLEPVSLPKRSKVAENVTSAPAKKLAGGAGSVMPSLSSSSASSDSSVAVGTNQHSRLFSKTKTKSLVDKNNLNVARSSRGKTR